MRLIDDSVTPPPPVRAGANGGDVVRIIDDSALIPFRASGRCEHCSRWCEQRHPHHWFVRKGFGGGTQLDHDWNLIGLCWRCHLEVHDGHIAQEDIAADVSKRVGVFQDKLRAFLNRVKWARKGSDINALLKEYGGGTRSSERTRTVDAEDHSADEAGPGLNGLHRDVPPVAPDGGGAGVAADQDGWSLL